MTPTLPRTMTRDYAIQEGFICDRDTGIEEERKEFPYVRVTNWYAESEEWMLVNTLNDMRGCDVLLIVSDDKQAVYRGRSQVRAITEE